MWFSWVELCMLHIFSHCPTRDWRRKKDGSLYDLSGHGPRSIKSHAWRNDSTGVNSIRPCPVFKAFNLILSLLLFCGEASLRPFLNLNKLFSFINYYYIYHNNKSRPLHLSFSFVAWLEGQWVINPTCRL